MNSMSYTKYILGLAAKNVTEEIRNEFCSNMGYETVRVFGCILCVAAKLLSTGKISEKDAEDLSRDEYLKCGLSDQIGNYDLVSDVVSSVLKESVSGSSFLDRNKSIIDAADMVPVSAIKTGLYVACLDSVVSCGIVLDDVDFTQKIVDYVDSSDTNEAGVEEFRSFADIALSASVHI